MKDNKLNLDKIKKDMKQTNKDIKKKAKEVKKDVEEKIDIITDKTKADYNKAKGDIKIMFGEMTDDDMIINEGRKDKLKGAAQDIKGTLKEAYHDLTKKD